MVSGIRAQTVEVFEEWASPRGVQEYFYKNVTKTDAARNVYVAGATLNGSGDYDLLITKFDRRGQLLWTNSVAGPGGGHDFATDLAFDHSGNVVVSGSIAASGGENNNMLAVKYNAAGTELWRYSHDHNDNAEGAAALVIDAANNIYLTGATQQSGGYTDIITIKIDSTAALQWEEVYDYDGLHDAGIRIELSGPRAVVTGGAQHSSLTWKVMTLSYLQVDGTLTGSTTSAGNDPGVEEVTDMVIDQNDNIYIAGSTINGLSGYDMLLIKLDEDLNIEWTKEWDGEGLTDKASGVRVTSNGDVYLCGTTETTAGDDIALIKLDADGDYIWEETYNSSGDLDDVATALEWHDEGYLYIAGHTFRVSNRDYLTLKYDSTGTLLWDITYNSPFNKDDRATNMALDEEGDIIVSGQCEKNDSVMTYYTVKYVERRLVNPNIALAPSGLVSFEMNAGQMRHVNDSVATEVKYYTERPVLPQYFQNDRISFVTNNYKNDTLLADTLDRVDLILYKDDEDAVVRGYDKTELYTNYYLGSTIQPILRNHHFQRLYYERPWRDIDFVVQKDALGVVRYSFVCLGQANLSEISLGIAGHQSLMIDSLGHIQVSTVVDTFVISQPQAYRIDSLGQSQPLNWTPAWTLDGDELEMSGSTENELFFIEFVVDQPSIAFECTEDFSQNNCTWSTYYGAGAGEQARGIDVSFNDKYMLVRKTALWVTPLTFVAGVSQIYEFPEDPELSDLAYTELVKFLANDDIAWITVTGSSEGEVNPTCVKYYEENIYVSGYTYATDMYVTQNADQSNYGGGEVDAFIARCNVDGQITWSTYLGGEGHEEIRVLEIDPINNRLIVAGIHSTNSCQSCLQQVTMAGAYNHGMHQGFQSIVGSFDLSTLEKNWLTFLGDQELEDGGTFGVSINDMTLFHNSLFICGELYNIRFGVTEQQVPITSSIQFPFGAPQGAHLETAHGEGIRTGFLTEFDLSNYSISWSTALAAANPNEEWSGGETAVSISGKRGENGDILAIALVSHSETLALMNGQSFGGYYQPINPNTNSTEEAATSAIVKFDSRIVDWATYIGVAGADVPKDILMDMDENIFLAGYSSKATSVELNDYCNVNQSGDFSLCSSEEYFFIDPTFNEPQEGISPIDGYLVSFKSTNELIWSSFFGGSLSGLPPDDMVNGLAQHPLTFELYIAGTTQGGCFPIFYQPNAYNQPEHGEGHFDAFVSKFSLDQLYFVTSMEDFNEPENSIVGIFPNPGSNYFQLQGNNIQDPVDIKIYDLKGAVSASYEQVNISGNAILIDASAWPSGMYVIRVTNWNFSETLKWIKQ